MEICDQEVTEVLQTIEALEYREQDIPQVEKVQVIEEQHLQDNIEEDKKNKVWLVKKLTIVMIVSFFLLGVSF